MANIPAYEDLMNKLREDIISEELRSGARVTISGLAKKYNVSTTPAREAIKSLQSEGYIEVIPRKGARVKEFNAKLIGDVYDVLAALDQMIVKSAVKGLSEAQVETWSEMVDKHHALYEAGKFEDVFLINKRLHIYFFDCCGNAPGKEAYERCYTSLNVVRSRFGISKERVEQSCKEHYLLVRLIKMREETAAGEIALKHTLRAKEEVIKRITASSKIK